MTTTTSVDEVESWAEQGYNLLPVWRCLVADDLTPVALLRRLSSEPQHFLFESVVGGESQARYSMLGCRPRARLSGDLQQLVCRDAHGQEETLHGDPYDALRGYLARFKTPDVQNLPRFCGGLVGYFGYDCVRLVEHLPETPPDHLGLPDIDLMHIDTVIVVDHSFNHLWLIAHADISRGQNLAEAYQGALDELDALQARVVAPLELAPVDAEQSYARVDMDQITKHTSRETFEASVQRLQEHIAAGDIFQAVPSQRLSAPCDATPLQVYRAVRSLNPSPYLFCVQMAPGTALVGASPEIMVRVEENQVTVRPIAGTRRRGKTPAEDAALAEELLADPKEIAEHTMLIDLGRNDVGRIAQPGSVTLTEKMIIEKYSHVQHIVSEVVGTLAEGLDALHAIGSCHPAGTVSGAPKIRAMELIDSVEPLKRGPYAGAVGYLDFRGNADTCIALRTAILHDGQAHVQAGAGVVADSIPANEYQETLDKAAAMLGAIGRAAAF
jgi:anthranilate synthase component 1